MEHQGCQIHLWIPSSASEIFSLFGPSVVFPSSSSHGTGIPFPVVLRTGYGQIFAMH